MPVTSLYNQELVSDEIQEVIKYRPNWVIRYGNSLLLGMIILFIGISWFIKMPETIPFKENIIINPGNSSAELIVSKTMTGKLQPGQQVYIVYSAGNTTKKLTGLISSITSDQKENSQVIITLDKHMAGYSKENLIISNGSVYIDQRLFNRIMDQLKQSWRKKKVT